MSPIVHYLIKHPTEARSLIYPTEIDNDQYVGFGGFFLLGKPGSALGDSFKFHAILGQQTLETQLIRFRNSKSLFLADVENVGSFLFYAQPIGNRPTYIGTDAQSQNLVALRRLRSWHPNELDQACRKHGFYFVGYSPRVSG